MRRIGLAMLGWLVMEGACSGAILEFAAGGQAYLPARVAGDAVVLLSPVGPFTFPRSDFRRIRLGFDPEFEWHTRRAEALRGSADDRFAAAWWALENGLTAEAQAMLWDAHRADHNHAPTARLAAMLERLRPASPQTSLTSLLDSLPGHWQVASGDHIVLVHQHPDAQAQERLRILERVVTTFYLGFAAQGIDLEPPQRKLVSIWFGEHLDYLAYLEREGARAFLTTRGYYHPTKGTIATYDPRSDAARRRRFETLAARRTACEARVKSTESLASEATVSLDLPGVVARKVTRDEALALLAVHQRDLDRQELLLELEWRGLDLGTAAHETVHQLVAQSGLAPHYADFPIWLHEGLAMQFEVVRGGRWAGVGRVNDLRLTDWRSSTPPPRLPPLLRGDGFGQGYRSGPYAQAWALVYYLRKERSHEFATWLELLRSPTGAPLETNVRAREAFLTAFGPDPLAIQANWWQYMEGVRSPFEDVATGPKP
jgi:hypothetical protein